jgi:hypothetical protein
MKNQILLMLVLAGMVSLSSCFYDDDGIFNCEDGVGPIVSRIVELPEFNGVNVEGSADVIITQGGEQLVEVKGKDNIIDRLELDVQDGIWDIEFDGCVRDIGSFTVIITVPEVDYLRIDGSGSIVSENVLETPDMVLRISGSGDMDLALDVLNLDASISGSGNILLEGICDEFDFKVTGSGDFFACDLEARKGEVKITGSGDARVFATDILDVDITGSGDVEFGGDPALTTSVSGSGDVIPGC